MKFDPPLSASEVEHAFNGRFQNVRPISDGGQGVVMAAESEPSGPLVALKIYFPGSVPERSNREVEAMAKLSCESLVRLFASGEVQIRGQRCFFVATDLIAGQTLAEAINSGVLPERIVAQLGCDISSAINALWDERIVHRDIKPQNIMVTPGGRAVLIDLGVARHLSLSSLTTMGKTWGTEGYMSPEHARALRQLSCKSDIFALGIVLQEAMLGRHPTGRNQLRLLTGGPSTAVLLPSASAPISAAIDAMLTLRPHLRPTPTQAIAALKLCA